MFCVAVVVLPFPSLNVQGTTEVPCVLRVSGSLVVPVIVPAQLSVVVGAAAMVAEHWPVTSANTGVAGAIVSSTTMFCVAVVVLPFPSLNVQVHHRGALRVTRERIAGRAGDCPGAVVRCGWSSGNRRRALARHIR